MNKIVLWRPERSQRAEAWRERERGSRLRIKQGLAVLSILEQRKWNIQELHLANREKMNTLPPPPPRLDLPEAYYKAGQANKNIVWATLGNMYLFESTHKSSFFT